WARSSSMRSAMWNDISRSMSRSRREGLTLSRRRRSHDMIDSPSPLCVFEDARHALGEPRPRLPLLLELPAACGRDRVEPCLASLLGDAPGGLQPAVLLHAVERRVERAFFDAKQFVGHALNVGRDR